MSRAKLEQYLSQQEAILYGLRDFVKIERPDRGHLDNHPVDNLQNNFESIVREYCKMLVKNYNEEIMRLADEERWKLGGVRVIYSLKNSIQVGDTTHYFKY